MVIQDPICESGDSQIFTDFQSAVHAVFDFLHQRLGFSMWMLTRCEGNSGIILSVYDLAYGAKAGDIFCWNDSLCSRMVKGLGPALSR